MIEVEVRIAGTGEQLALLRITNLEIHSDETADYIVETVIQRGQAIGLHGRSFRRFPRLKYNALGLLKQALETFEEEEMRLEGGFAPSRRLARRLEHSWGSFPR